MPGSPAGDPHPSNRAVTHREILRRRWRAYCLATDAYAVARRNAGPSVTAMHRAVANRAAAAWFDAVEAARDLLDDIDGRRRSR